MEEAIKQTDNDMGIVYLKRLISEKEKEVFLAIPNTKLTISEISDRVLKTRCGLSLFPAIKPVIILKDIIDKSLNFAAECGNLEAVKFLVSKGADVNMSKGPLPLASRNGHLEVVKFLISIGADINRDCPLAEATAKGNLEIVKFLVSVGADIHWHNDMPIEIASYSCQFEIIKFLLTKGADINSIVPISKSDNLEEIKFLVSSGANIHQDNDYALRYASENGYLETVKYLISIGAKLFSNSSLRKWPS